MPDEIAEPWQTPEPAPSRLDGGDDGAAAPESYANTGASAGHEEPLTEPGATPGGVSSADAYRDLPDEPAPFLVVRSNSVCEVAETTRRVYDAVHKALVGQDEVLESAFAGLLAGGHVLLEGVPGTAKTLLVRALACALSTDYGRIQFTPDLMPSDVTGTRIYDMQKSEFTFRKGPIFTNLLLADEINRTPPKTQAALLEAMQERQVTIDGEAFPLPPLFMVFATQNPVEFEGTYVLPEAQLDRFMLKVRVAYPSQTDEEDVLRRRHRGFDSSDLESAGITPVADAETILRLRAIASEVRVEDALFRYMASLSNATRNHRQVVLGASPRASIALLQVSKALAAMRGRDFVTPDDIKSIAVPVLRHRLLLRPDAEIEGLTSDDVITDILDQLEVPR